MSPLVETKKDLFTTNQKFIRVQNQIFVAPPFTSSFNHQWLMETDNINHSDIDDAGEITMQYGKHRAIGDAWTINFTQGLKDNFHLLRENTNQILDSLPK